ncbi:MAG: hypothetical protein M1823_006203 [Watsoniomyces obsoletus]|nr:MAG: hypothetical protein M1823_006203 [Watsoniomyces obsoletus]
MSSSQPFITSSPLSATSGTARRRRSRFTYRHLSQLSASSPTSPLRVIAHIDLDAFYAQCETVRLGIPEDQPLAVQQWGGLIAINYPARAFGLTRFATAVEAKKACPHIITQHVATWKEGQEKWAYYDDAAENIATHKVSLDPYRLQSRKILALIKDVLPPSPLQRVEKASIDEVFLDLSAQIHSILLERYPELKAPAPYDDPAENLPRPPTTALDWDTDAVVDLDETETEDDDPDWDDIAMLIGSEIVRGVRAAIREQLRYTCSAGIAQNKMLAKLGSAHKKPNQQTIVRNRAVQQFMSGFKFTKIRNLGGKFGDEVVSIFGTETVKDLLSVPLDQMKRKLGDDHGTWVYQIIRGIDSSEVNARTQIKSMLSAKSFRPTINTMEQAERWLRIFAADIFSRLVEEGVLDHRRRPKTINLHHRHRGQTKARQMAIPSGRAIDEGVLFELAKGLLIQIIAEGDVWPCANLSLSVAGFEDGITGNRKIGSFLVTGEEALALKASNSTTTNSTLASTRSEQQQQQHHQHQPEPPLSKRRRIDDGRTNMGIQKFFKKSNSVEEPLLPARSPDDVDHQRVEDVNADLFPPVTAYPSTDEAQQHEHEHGDQQQHNESRRISLISADLDNENNNNDNDAEADQFSLDTTYPCPQCRQLISRLTKDEHDDWHLAKMLQRQEHDRAEQQHLRGRSIANPSSTDSSATQVIPVKKQAAGVGVGVGTSATTSHAKVKVKVEKGQRRLMFGK